MGEKLYTLRLTYAQLWQLRESYEASFTAPEERDGTALEIAAMLDKAHAKAWKDRRSAARQTNNPAARVPDRPALSGGSDAKADR